MIIWLDSDLAEIYGYTTKRLNEQVKNNIEKFDEEDLMFQLTKEEVKELSRSKILTLNNEFLRSKFSTSKQEHILESDSSRSKFSTLKNETKSNRGGNIKYAPYAFTEQGVYMLMTVLKGELATKQSKALVRLFKKMKDYVIENQEILNHRDFLRLSLQTADNAQNIIEFRQKLTEDEKIYLCGSSSKDGERKITTISKIDDTSLFKPILAQIQNNQVLQLR